MRRVAFVLTFLLASCAASRPFALRHQEECGNPMVESVSFFAVEGSAGEVTSPRSFRLHSNDGRLVHVIVPNLGEPFHPAAADELRRLLAGKPVTVLVGMEAREDPEITGQVHAGTEDVSTLMLRAGMAAYTDAPAYKLSSYSECLHRIAAREAKR